MHPRLDPACDQHNVRPVEEIILQCCYLGKSLLTLFGDVNKEKYMKYQCKRKKKNKTHKLGSKR